MHTVVLSRWTWTLFAVALLAGVACVLWPFVTSQPIPVAGLARYVDNRTVAIPLLALMLACAIPLALPRVRTITSVAVISGVFLCAGFALMFYVGGGMGLICVFVGGGLGSDARAAFDRVAGDPAGTGTHTSP